MNKIFSSIFLIVGTIIGAGFASGRELSLFFAEFGYASLFFLPIVFILFYYCFKLFLVLGSKNEYKNVLDINNDANSSIFFNITIVAVFFIYTSAMFSGGVEVLSSIFVNITPLIFYFILGITLFIVLKFGLNGLLKINFILIPIIVILLTIYSIYSTLYPITTLPFIPENTNAHILPISIIFYVFSNILLSYFIIAQTGNRLTPSEIKKVSFGSAFIVCLVILICIVCLIKNGAIVMQATMPFVVLTFRLGEPFPLIFMSILFVGITTSLFTCAYTLVTTFKAKNKNLLYFIVIGIVGIISILGFKTIVNTFYPIVGILGLVVIAKVLIYSKPLKNDFSLKSKVLVLKANKFKE